MARLSRPTRTTGTPGTYLGKVTRVVGSECYVEVKALARGFEYGPARFPHGSGVAKGHDVAVAFLDGGDLVVLVRLA